MISTYLNLKPLICPICDADLYQEERAPKTSPHLISLTGGCSQSPFHLLYSILPDAFEVRATYQSKKVYMENVPMKNEITIYAQSVNSRSEYIIYTGLPKDFVEAFSFAENHINSYLFQ